MAKTAERSRDEVLAEAQAELREELGKLGGPGFGLPLAEQPVQELPRISTGSLRLDDALGGGIPRGRITEIYGPEAGGKTSLCYAIIGQAQAQGIECAFVDAEQTFDTEHCRKFGVDPDRLWYVQPSHGEQALEAVRRFCSKGLHGLVVTDSIAALVPEAMLRGEIGDAQMGVRARMMSQALSMLTPAVAANNVALVFTNQLRMKIGVMFGNPETTTGGEAMKFYASMRLTVRRKGDFIKDGEDPIGMNIRVYSQKNKTARPMRAAELTLLFDKGFDYVGEAVDFAVERDKMKKAGAWYTWGEQRWQGRDTVIDWLREHPEAYSKLLTEIRN